MSQVQVNQNQLEEPEKLKLPLNGTVNTLDPGLIFNSSQIEVVEQLFLGLTEFDPNTYEVQPALAKDWQVNAKGTVYTFHLRPEAKWSHGVPVTAHDVVWTIQRNIAKELESPYVTALFLLKNAAAINQGQIQDVTQIGVRAIDDYTVEFNLERPAGYFPAVVNLWSYRPLPHQIVEQYGIRWTAPEHIQTNGPYQLSEWNEGKKLLLTKNPHFFDNQKVNIPQIHYSILQESSLALAMYEKNELDVIGGLTYLPLPFSEITRIKTDPVLRQQRKNKPAFCTQWYGFNTQRPPMNNLLVRKAIAAAIDKKTLLNFVVQEEHTIANTLIPPPLFGAADPKAEMGILFNPEQAKAWLAEAGYPEGQGLPKISLMYNISEMHQQVALALKAILKHHLNIELELQPFDFLSYIDVFEQSPSPHMFRMGMCVFDYPDAHDWLYRFFHPTQGVNWVNWNHREFTTVIEQAEKSTQPEERQKLYQRAEQILVEEEVAIIPLYFLNYQFLVKPWVKNWYYMSFGGQQIRNWVLEH